MVLALLLVAAGGVGAYWFGWARYTATPAVLGLTRDAAVERLEKVVVRVVGEEGLVEYPELVHGLVNNGSVELAVKGHVPQDVLEGVLGQGEVVNLALG